MRALSLLAAGLALALTAAAARAEAAFGPLLTPDGLADAVEAHDPLILDIRGGMTEDGRTVYETGHVPGAVFAPYRFFRGPETNPGEVPSEADLTRIFRILGVEKDRPAVIVHQGRDATDFGAAARVYWTLKSAGVREIAILNGGVAAWTEDGRPLETGETAVMPSEITVEISDRWLAAQADVEAAVKGEAEARLLDARPAEFRNGEAAHPAASRPGTLPRSDYFEHSGWFDDGPAIVDAAAARRLAEEQGLTGGAAPIVSFCNTGHWAATNWFALSELAGVENVKLYPESLVGWSNAGLEMDNVPTRLQALMHRLRALF